MHRASVGVEASLPFSAKECEVIIFNNAGVASSELGGKIFQGEIQ
jgi:hypothetical protein